LELIT